MDAIRPLVIKFAEQLSDMLVPFFWSNLGNVLQDLLFDCRF